jgi:hypothetical protein
VLTVVSANLRCQAGEVDGCAVLVARGELGRREAPLLDGVLAKLVLDRGRVFIDVSELTATWSPALAIFSSVLAKAGGWPLARLVLVGPSRDLGRALRVSRISAMVPVAADWPQAHRLIEVRPSVISRWRDIPAGADGGLVARAASWEACRDWELSELGIPAAIVATELVSNAVRHAGTSCRLTFTVDRFGLRVSVRDHRAPSEADLVSIRARYESCHGLAVVANLSRSWGVIPHQCGKTVWAMLTQA